MPVDQEKLAKLMASVRTGGKGSVRRKKQAVPKPATTGQLPLFVSQLQTTDYLSM